MNGDVHMLTAINFMQTDKMHYAGHVILTEQSDVTSFNLDRRSSSFRLKCAIEHVYFTIKKDYNPINANFAPKIVFRLDNKFINLTSVVEIFNSICANSR